MGGLRMIYTLTLNPAIDYVIDLEEVKLGELNRINKNKFLTGGKGINVSRILKELGYSTTALGFIGGFTGEFVASELKKEKLITDFVQIQEDTRINIKVKATEETELNGAGPKVNSEAAEILLKQIGSIKPADTVIISGSKALNLPDDYYQQIIKKIKEIDANFVIDTTGKDLESSLQYEPLLVKPNDVELAELFNVSISTEQDYIKYGEKLLKKGAQYVIVSLGGDGALLLSKNGNYRGYAPKGNVHNTIGAGDSMVAGFVGTYLQTKDLVQAFKVSLASGSATAFKEDLATKEEIENLLPKIKIDKL